MPGKSRQRRGKHKQQSKSKKSRRSPQGMDFRQQITEQAEEIPNIMPEAAVSSTVVKARIAARNPELISELRRIGIFTGIMLVALVLLAIVLN